MTTSISSVLVECLRRLNNLTSRDELLAHADKVPTRLWTDELGRLRVWAANIGAHQTGQSSLEYRLRDASHIRAQTIKLLERLRRTLDDADEFLAEGVDEDGDMSADEDGETELQQIYKGVVDTIDCLFQLSMIIRRPAQHDKLLGSRKLDATVFEPFDRQHVANKHPKLGNTVVDRLGAAISRRRAALKYRERHHAKLSKGIESAVAEPTDRSSAGNLTERRDAVSTLLSQTIATEFEETHIDYEETASNSGLSQTSYAPSLTESSETITVPHIPRDAAFGKPFECPYCFFIVTVSNRRSWARHVFKDLMPYVCVFSDCSAPNRLYDSRRDWFQHLRSKHIPSIDPGEADSCPLHCGVNVPVVLLERHLGRHLEELALFALPRTVGDEEESNDSRKSVEPTIEEAEASDTDSDKITPVPIPPPTDQTAIERSASKVQCTVLKVRPFEARVANIDVLLSKGTLQEGDRIVLCGNDGPIATTIGGLSAPAHVKEVTANPQLSSRRVTIAAHNLANAVAGSPVLVVGQGDDERTLMLSVMANGRVKRQSLWMYKVFMYLTDSLQDAEPQLTLESLRKLIEDGQILGITVPEFGYLQNHLHSIEQWRAEVNQFLLQSPPENSSLMSPNDYAINAKDLETLLATGRTLKVAMPEMTSLTSLEQLYTRKRANADDGGYLEHAPDEHENEAGIALKDFSEIHGSSPEVLDRSRKGLEPPTNLTTRHLLGDHESFLEQPVLLGDSPPHQSVLSKRLDKPGVPGDESQLQSSRSPKPRRNKIYTLGGSSEEEEEEDAPGNREDSQAEDFERLSQDEREEKVPTDLRKKMLEEEEANSLMKKMIKAGYSRDDVEEIYYHETNMTNRGVREKSVTEKFINPHYDTEMLEAVLRRTRTQSTRAANESHPPIFIKVSRKYIHPDTLDQYGIPWELDEQDTELIIIKRYIDEPLQDELSEHTRRLRARGIPERRKHELETADDQDDDVNTTSRSKPSVAEHKAAGKLKEKDSIGFVDAIGRKYAFPFVSSRRWKDMKALINAAFEQIEDLAGEVAAGRYSLHGPDDKIIEPKDWDSVIEPGMQITMNIWHLPDIWRDMTAAVNRIPSPNNRPGNLTTQPMRYIDSDQESDSSLESRRGERKRRKHPSFEDIEHVRQSPALSTEDLEHASTAHDDAVIEPSSVPDDVSKDERGLVGSRYGEGLAEIVRQGWSTSDTKGMREGSRESILAEQTRQKNQEQREHERQIMRQRGLEIATQRDRERERERERERSHQQHQLESQVEQDLPDKTSDVPAEVDEQVVDKVARTTGFTREQIQRAVAEDEASAIKDAYLIVRENQQRRVDQSSRSMDDPELELNRTPSSSLDHSRDALWWTTDEDETLLSAKAQGLSWEEIRRSHFPSKTASACRKRHERLLEKMRDDDSHSIDTPISTNVVDQPDPITADDSDERDDSEYVLMPVKSVHRSSEHGSPSHYYSLNDRNDTVLGRTSPTPDSVRAKDDAKSSGQTSLPRPPATDQFAPDLSLSRLEHLSSLTEPNFSTVDDITQPGTDDADERQPSQESNQSENVTRVHHQQRFRPITAAEWETHKEIIKDLYVTQGLPLAEVVERMKQQYGFETAPSVYKVYLRKWNLTRWNLTRQPLEGTQEPVIAIERVKHVKTETQPVELGREGESHETSKRGEEAAPLPHEDSVTTAYEDHLQNVEDAAQAVEKLLPFLVAYEADSENQPAPNRGSIEQYPIIDDVHHADEPSDTAPPPMVHHYSARLRVPSEESDPQWELFGPESDSEDVPGKVERERKPYQSVPPEEVQGASEPQRRQRLSLDDDAWVDELRTNEVGEIIGYPRQTVKETKEHNTEGKTKGGPRLGLSDRLFQLAERPGSVDERPSDPRTEHRKPLDPPTVQSQSGPPDHPRKILKPRSLSKRKHVRPESSKHQAQRCKRPYQQYLVCGGPLTGGCRRNIDTAKEQFYRK